ncbi:hypothetical protein [Flavivirga algicola]|uniref:Lipoprotein n=1 Tax=Flavivirga algicola TaxID=2729136 RepID=A0ABX1S5D9_9FLAO|nr:hypothetical protein [Flavivirga algicola]NMH89949.1 hypothetical protein [Flavivirga algicola]
MKRYLPIIFLIFLFSLSACEPIFNCIIGVKPILHSKTLDNGFIAEYYTEVITAKIKNKINDDDFSYSFDVSGLPVGLKSSSEGHRKLILKGVPRESGEFIIEVFVNVRSVNGEDKLCRNRASKSYTLTIK